MASIRRTQPPPPPAQPPSSLDRTYQNGGTNSPHSVASPSRKFLTNNTKPSPLFSSSASTSASAATAFLQKRKGLRRSFYRCLFCALLGFLLGMFPFGHVDNDIRNRDFSFEIDKPDDNRSFEHMDSQRIFDNHSFKHGDSVLNTVNLASSSKLIDENDNRSVKRINSELIDDRLADSVVNTVNLAKMWQVNDDVNDSSVEQMNKQLIVITPTYNRALQAYYLNRLGQVLRLVPPPLLWIVVEMRSASMETAEILRKTGVMYRHLVCSKNLTNFKNRGVYQRNVALEHIERHRLDGIVYFADDENVYSLELFNSLRNISRFGTWPVAMLAQSKNKVALEGPVCNGSAVIGWHTNEKSKRLRRFHVDMSGFAFNSTILWDPKRWNRSSSNPIRQLETVKGDLQETTFIEQVVEDESQMEGLQFGCSVIMNWHLHLDAHGLAYSGGWMLQKNLDAVSGSP